ncbi:MAG: hypothetical protein QNK37_05825 [Acidobacteriota bacterium]|nr:hypothetical protein [Acidobacteriota bacterium]
MKENQFELIQEFDRLESLLEKGAEASRKEAGELAGELDVVRLLMRDASQDIQMPRQQAFRDQVMQQVRPVKRKNWWMAPGLAVAAALVLALLLIPQQKKAATTGVIQVDPELLARAESVDNRDAMIAYLEQAEVLLTSIREFDMQCSEDQTDLTLEKKLARTMLMRQKTFITDMDKPRFYQARDLFAQLETILVDLNGLDVCTDTMDLEFLNEHISKNRILSKVRMVAQDIQLS